MTKRPVGLMWYLVEEVGGDYGLDDVLHDLGAELLVGKRALGVLVRELGVLGGDDNSVDADRLVVGIVLDGYLRLAVGAEVRELAVLANFGELVRQLVGQRDGRGHQLGRLVGGIAKHHALVACAAGVDTLRDVGGLAIDGRDDSAGVGVEALEGIVITDLVDRVADEGLEVDVGLGGDLTGDDDEAGAGESLAGDAAVGIFGQAGVEDSVGDLVGDLVGMTFGHGLTGEEETVGVGRQSGKLLRSDSRTRSGENRAPDDRPLVLRMATGVAAALVSGRSTHTMSNRGGGTLLFYLRMGPRPTRNSGEWILRGERWNGGVEEGGRERLGSLAAEDLVGKFRAEGQEDDEGGDGPGDRSGGNEEEVSLMAMKVGGGTEDCVGGGVCGREGDKCGGQRSGDFCVFEMGEADQTLAVEKDG
jgi:hypothetical protein